MAVVCPPNLSIVYGLWIKLLLNQIKSASETVYESFYFSLELLGVLSKQLA